MTYTGIDVSKGYFDVDFGSIGVRRFQNSAAGISEFLKKVDPTTMCVVEATGPYSWSLVLAAYNHGIPIAMENPLKVRRFAQSRFQRAKTDCTDARMLSMYGEAQKPMAFVPPPMHVLQLRQLLGVYEQLVAQRTSCTNQLEALTHMPICDPVAKAVLRSTERSIDTQITKTTTAMDALIAEHCPQLAKHLQSIPGVGKHTARVVIALAGDWSRFRTAKAFVAFVGLCPRIYESGTSVRGSRGIIKLGDPMFRSSLYMCSLSAIRVNNACRAQYARLRANGKAKMTALVAAMHKLARQIWAVATTNEPFNNERALGTIRHQHA